MAKRLMIAVVGAGIGALAGLLIDYLGAGTAAPGSATSISNSQCTLNAANSSVTGSGNRKHVTISWKDNSITETAFVLQKSTNGTTWTSVGSAINRYSATNGWVQASIDLSAYKGQTVYLGFLGTSKYGDNIYLDDVTVVGQ